MDIPKHVYIWTVQYGTYVCIYVAIIILKRKDHRLKMELGCLGGVAVMRRRVWSKYGNFVTFNKFLNEKNWDNCEGYVWG